MKQEWKGSFEITYMYTSSAIIVHRNIVHGKFSHERENATVRKLMKRKIH